ncbi:MAG: tail fiber domain-containing protein [Verrucomicrobiota bacterium]
MQTNAEAAANRYNISSPFGSQTWTQGDRQIIGYDSKGTPQYGQNYTQTIQLNPSEQRQYDLHNQIAESLLNGAGDKISGFQDTPFSYGGTYKGPSSYSGAGTYAGQSQPFDYSQATPEVAQAQYQKTVNLLQPQFDRQNKDLEQKLANQGIPIGSDAYNEAVRNQSQNQNSALTNAALDATTMGNQLALSQRQQNVGEGAQTYGINADEMARSFGLNANAGLQARQQQNQEALSQRQQQYNELAAALGGQQLNPINNGGSGGASPLDVSGAYQQKNQANLTNAQLKNQGLNSLMGGIFGAGAGLLGNTSLFSDERLKEDIEQVGELPGGEGVYEYSYKGDPERFRGVIAQEIEQTQPDAVTDTPSGYKAVDYRKVIAKALAEAA